MNLTRMTPLVLITGFLGSGKTSLLRLLLPTLTEVGVTPEGKIYKLAKTSLGEVAGACFSPDGTTLFVNIQTPGLTVAITGPWQKLRAIAI